MNIIMSIHKSTLDLSCRFTYLHIVARNLNSRRNEKKNQWYYTFKSRLGKYARTLLWKLIKVFDAYSGLCVNLLKIYMIESWTEDWSNLHTEWTRSHLLMAQGGVGVF